MRKNLQTKIDDVYTKNFNSLVKKLCKSKHVGITLFVEYLKYLRDSMIADILTEDINNNICINTIMTAIAEYEAYISYKDSTTRAFHWHNFCELIKQNMEEWLQANDSL